MTAINEGALIVDAGVVSPMAIDEAMSTHAGYVRGPLGWADKIGRHTCAGLLRRLNEPVADDRFKAAGWLSG